MAVDGVLDPVEATVPLAAEVTVATVVAVLTAPAPGVEVIIVEGTVEPAIVDAPAGSVGAPAAAISLVTIRGLRHPHRSQVAEHIARRRKSLVRSLRDRRRLGR